MVERNIESLIKLSCGYYDGINSILPKYTDRINYFESKKSQQDENSDSDISDFYVEMPELLEEDYLLIEAGDDEEIDLTNVKGPRKVILHTKKSNHFASLFISADKKAYLMDSLPNHTNWKFIGDYTINNVPVPLQKNNECLINTFVNLENAEEFKRIYDSSKMNNAEIQELMSKEIRVAGYKALKDIVDNSKNVKELRQKLDTSSNPLILENKEIVSLISNILNQNSKEKEVFSNFKKSVDNAINVEYKTITKEKPLTKVSKTISNSNNTTVEVISLSSQKSLKEEIEEFKEIEKELLSLKSNSSEEKVVEKDSDELIKDKELAKKLEEIKKQDKSFAEDIIANIKMARDLKKTNAEKEEARKNAEKEAKIMLQI